MDISALEIRLPAGSFRTRTAPLRVTLTRYDYEAHLRVRPAVANNPPEFFVFLNMDYQNACVLLAFSRIGFRLLPPD